MGCGCKQKRIDEAARAAQQPAQIKFTENPPKPPEPIQTPVQKDVENILEKLKAIVTPQ